MVGLGSVWGNQVGTGKTAETADRQQPNFLIETDHEVDNFDLVSGSDDTYDDEDAVTASEQQTPTSAGAAESEGSCSASAAAPEPVEFEPCISDVTSEAVATILSELWGGDTMVKMLRNAVFAATMSE